MQMQNIEFRRCSTRRRLTLLPTQIAVCGLFLSGCASTRLVAPVNEFGQLTSQASADQVNSLSAIAADEDERFHADLAKNLSDLRLKSDCAALLGQISAAIPTDKSTKCDFVVGGMPLERPPTFEHLVALSKGLNGYAEGLIALVADRKADNQAFATSVSALGTSLAKLDGAVQKAVKGTSVDRSAKLGAIASLVAEAGQLVFARKRDQALRRIIIAGEPVVQDATGLLAATDERIDLYDRAGVAQQLIAAQRDQSSRVLSKDPVALRTAQDRMFRILATFNQNIASRDRFAAIGKAHTSLTKTAREGASAEDLKAAIVSIAHLASTIQATVKAFGEKKGGKE